MYCCKECNFYTIYISNYNQHVKTNKHKKNIKIDNFNINKIQNYNNEYVNNNIDDDNISETVNNNIVDDNTSETINNNIIDDTSESVNNNIVDDNTCEYCFKKFKHKTSLYRHKKHRCKVKKNMLQKEHINNHVNNNNSDISNINNNTNNITHQHINNTVITNNNNIQNHQNINININLLSYKDTDASHLTDKDYIDSINRTNNCVCEYIKRLHFNPDKPENHNIIISNKRNNELHLFKENMWQVEDKKETIDDLIDNTDIKLEEWLYEFEERNPNKVNEVDKLKKLYNHYIDSKDDEELNKQIKERLELMMYNHRSIPEKTKKQLKL